MHLWMWVCHPKGWIRPHRGNPLKSYYCVWCIYRRGCAIPMGRYIPRGLIHWFFYNVWCIDECGCVMPRGSYDPKREIFWDLNNFWCIDECGCIIPRVSYDSKGGITWNFSMIDALMDVVLSDQGSAMYLRRKSMATFLPCLMYLWTCLCHPKGQIRTYRENSL